MTDSRERLLRAMIFRIAEKGYAATTVEEVCIDAGVTKGAFFHHFPSKETLTVAAVNTWSAKCSVFYNSASYVGLRDPLERLLGYLDFRKNTLHVPIASISGVFAMLVREISDSHPDICDACEKYILSQCARVKTDVTEAYELYGSDLRWTPAGLAMLTHAILQGIHVLARTKDEISLAGQSLDHLRHYVELLFRKTRFKKVPVTSRRLTESSMDPAPKP